MICLSSKTYINITLNKTRIPPHSDPNFHIKNYTRIKYPSTFSSNPPYTMTCKQQSPMMLTSGASGRIKALFSLRMVINAMVVKQHDNKKKGVRVPATMVWKKKGGSRVVDQEVATRRSIAIKRVKEEEKINGYIRDYSLFVNCRGDTLFTQSWTSVSVTIRGVIVLMHGLNEHSGRYSEFAKLLNANGFKVYGMDWIGHGGSDGLHAYVHSLDDAITDFKSYLEKVMAENPGLPCFCFGHSTGAAIILKAVLDPKIQAHISGIALTSPAVGVQPTHSIFVIIAPVIAFLLPRYQISGAQKVMPVSRDPEALVAKYSDPLVYTGSIRVRTGYEILRITSYLQENLNKVKVPLLVLHGTADTVTDPAASQKLYEEASSSDKTIKLLEGFLHDLLFEPECKEIANHIIQWLTRRVQG